MPKFPAVSGPPSPATVSSRRGNLSGGCLGCKQICSKATTNLTFSRMGPAVRIPSAPATSQCEPLLCTQRTERSGTAQARGRRIPQHPLQVVVQLRGGHADQSEQEFLPDYRQRLQQVLLNRWQPADAGGPRAVAVSRSSASRPRWKVCLEIGKGAEPRFGPSNAAELTAGGGSGPPLRKSR